MPKSGQIYTMFISCPSDVDEFISDIKEAVDDFNNTYGKKNGIIINTTHWKKDSYPHSSKEKSAQEEINMQLLSEADMMAGFFWTRFGQPTEKYGSGTEEEINYMLDNGKDVFLYFLDKEVAPSKIDAEQLMRINEFRSKRKDLYKVLKDTGELTPTLTLDLQKHFDKKTDNNENSQKKNPTNNRSNSRNSKSILWVDDHPENNTYGREYFDSNGIEVIPVLSTQQALRYLENYNVDIIISDMKRKEGAFEGYALLDTLREKGNETPFIIFCGERRKEFIEETIKHGGQGLTNDFSELFNIVTKILLGTFEGQRYLGKWTSIDLQ